MPAQDRSAQSRQRGQDARRYPCSRPGRLTSLAHLDETSAAIPARQQRTGCGHEPTWLLVWPMGRRFRGKQTTTSWQDRASSSQISLPGYSRRGMVRQYPLVTRNRAICVDLSSPLSQLSALRRRVHQVVDGRFGLVCYGADAAAITQITSASRTGAGGSKTTSCLLGDVVLCVTLQYMRHYELENRGCVGMVLVLVRLRRAGRSRVGVRPFKKLRTGSRRDQRVRQVDH
jgi:hypothetical protein